MDNTIKSIKKFLIFYPDLTIVGPLSEIMGWWEGPFHVHQGFPIIVNLLRISYCKFTRKSLINVKWTPPPIPIISPGRKCHVGSPLGPKNLELGVWSLAPGAWSLELKGRCCRAGASKIKAVRHCKITMFFGLEMASNLN